MCNNEKDSFPKEIFLAREERKGVFKLLLTVISCMTKLKFLSLNCNDITQAYI